MIAQAKVFEILLPVFLTIALGYVFGRLKEINLKPIIDVMLFLTIPCLIISSITRAPFSGGDFAQIAIAAVFVVLATGGITFIALRSLKIDKAPGIYMGSMFMNSGIIAFPIILSAFGLPGLSKAIIFDAVNAALIFSLGVLILVGKEDLSRFLKLPMIYAIIGSVIMNFMGIKIYRPLLDTLTFVGDSSLPIMLLVLGYQLNYMRQHAMGHAILASVLRLGCGIAFSLLFVSVFGISGMTRKVILFSSSMPTAMNSLLLSEEFRVDPDVAASAVVTTTLLSFFTIPVVLRYLM